MSVPRWLRDGDGEEIVRYLLTEVLEELEKR